MLKNTHSELKEVAKAQLTGKEVTLCVDGWSNVSNDPILGFTVQADSRVYIVSSVNTSGNRHTAEYLGQLVNENVPKIEEEFGCVISQSHSPPTQSACERHLPDISGKKSDHSRKTLSNCAFTKGLARKCRRRDQGASSK